MTVRFFGVDGEMSAADLSGGGRLIQVGVVAHTDAAGVLEADGSDVFTSVIRPAGEFAWDEEAAAVHGLTVDDVLDAPAAAEVDAALHAWLVARGASPTGAGSVIAVGFNVGSFDLPHLAAVLPRSAALFSRRSVDLNALCFTLDGATYAGSVPSWTGWKRMAKRYAEAEIAALSSSAEPNAHDAGYDAQLHLFCWRFLRAASQGRPLPQPDVVVPDPESQVLAHKAMSAFGAARAAEMSGVPEAFVRGWAHGGRATRGDYLEALRALVAEHGL